VPAAALLIVMMGRSESSIRTGEAVLPLARLLGRAAERFFFPQIISRASQVLMDHDRGRFGTNLARFIIGALESPTFPRLGET
jgi:hypothetical protein